MAKIDRDRLSIKITLAVQESVSYETRRLLGVNTESDQVPPGRDPVEYLRERVIAELDRITLAPGVSFAPRAPLVNLFPAVEPASEVK